MTARRTSDERSRGKKVLTFVYKIWISSLDYYRQSRAGLVFWEMEDAMFQDASDTFMRWLKDQPGVKVSPKIGLEDYSEEGCGRGVLATADIQDNELLFSIPRNLLLSWENSALSAKLPKEETEDLGDWDLLILAMLRECSDPGSRWAAYFKILPENFSTPMFWNDVETAELQASTLSSKIGRAEADQSYTETILPIIHRHPDIFNIEACSLKQFHRMGSLIMAYSFDAPKDDSNDDDEEEEEEAFEKVMCPLADLLNAHTVLNNARLFYEPDSLDMRATHAIPCRQQIYNTYGDLPNSDLLRRYGYTQFPNDADIVEVPGNAVTNISNFISAEEAEGRIDWLLDMEILDDSFEIGISGKVPKEVLITLDVMALPKEEFQRIKETADGLPKGIKSQANKEKILKILEDILSGYATTIDHDERLLQQSELAFNTRNAVAVRLGEKRILHTAMKTVSEWGVLSDGPSKKRPIEDSTRTAKKSRAD